MSQILLSEIRTIFPGSFAKRRARRSLLLATADPSVCSSASMSEEDWFDYQLESDPRFLRRIEKARDTLREGRDIRIEDLK